MQVRAQLQIGLPRLDVSGAVALAGELFAAAKEERNVPKSVSESLRQLKRTVKTLEEADRGRIAGDPEMDKVRALEALADAMRSSSHAWSAFDRWVGGWARLPDGGEDAESARRVQAVLFKDGRAFMRGSPKKVWVASNQRLKLVEEKDLEEEIERLGGAVFLARIQSAHARLGERLSVVQTAKRNEVSPVLRPHLDAFRDQLRDYVVQVSATDRSKRSRERADRLLAPIAQWKSKRVRAKAVQVQPQAAQPVPPVAPSGS
jgi:hypothetical protein